MRCLFILFATIPLAAQVTTGSITGYILDPIDHAIPAAKIHVADKSRGVERMTITDGAGFYRVADLAPGLYQVSVVAKGFRDVTVVNATVAVNSSLRLDLHPPLAGRTDAVTVTTEIGPAQNLSSELGVVLGQGLISDLPLNQRDFLQLALLVPGVLPPIHGSELSTRGNFAMHANGAREEFNNFLLDGVDNNDQDTNRYVLQPAVDAIQEFKIATNGYSAEYGRSGGAQVNVITRSGSNALHGSGYEYLRNRDFDARNFFDGRTKPKYTRNQFGAAVGGPIRRDHTFFFADYDGLRGHQGFSRLATVPTPEQRDGNLSGSTPVVDPFTGSAFPGNQIPSSRVSPIARQILALYPLPTNNDGAGNYLGQPVGEDSLNQFNLRVDQRLRNQDQVSVRYSYGYKRIFEPYAENSQQLPGFGDYVEDRGHNALLSYTRFFDARTTNSLLMGFNRAGRRILPQNYRNDVNSLWGVTYLPVRPVEFGYPSINVLGLSLAGDVATLPIDRHNNTYQLTERFTHLQGTHALQAGLEFRKLELNGIIDVYARGSISFLGAFTQSGLGDLLLGLPTFAIQGRSTAPQTLRTFASNLYVQDDWRLRPALTLNLGIRYEYNTPPTDPTNRMSVLDLVSRRLVQVGAHETSRSGISPDRNNVAPRIGFAWNAGRQFVVRGAYGLFYDTGMFVVNSALYFNPPFFTIRVFTPGPQGLLTLQDPFPSVAGFSPPASLSTLSPDTRTAYLQDWNLNVQRSVNRLGTWSIAYAGSKGTHLIRSRDLNQPRPGPGDVDSRRPYRDFSNIFFVEGGANSSFHSLQLSFSRPVARGLAALGSFTVSKSIDDASTFLGTPADKNFPQDSSNYRAERAVSSFDIRRYATLAVLYALPRKPWLTRGFQIGGILRVQTGQPFTPLLTADNSNTGNTGGQFGSDHPNVLRKPNVPNPGPGKWFDTSAFAVPAPFTFGNAGRNVLRGHGYSSLDLSVSRKVSLSERLAMTVEAQSFNTLNRANFDLPQLYTDQPGFGRIFSAKTPRQIQFSTRLIF